MIFHFWVLTLLFHTLIFHNACKVIFHDLSSIHQAVGTERPGARLQEWQSNRWGYFWPTSLIFHIKRLCKWFWWCSKNKFKNVLFLGGSTDRKAFEFSSVPWRWRGVLHELRVRRELQLHRRLRLIRPRPPWDPNGTLWFHDSPIFLIYQCHHHRRKFRYFVVNVMKYCSIVKNIGEFSGLAHSNVKKGE